MSYTSILDLVWSSYGTVNNSSKESVISRISKAWEKGGEQCLCFNMYDITTDRASSIIAIRHVFDDEEYPDIILSSLEQFIEHVNALEDGAIPT